jgi:hypothetical protein
MSPLPAERFGDQTAQALLDYALDRQRERTQPVYIVTFASHGSG